MSSDVRLHVIYQIANAPVRAFPYMHIYVPEIFPPDFYRELRTKLPPAAAYQTLHALGRVSAAYSDKRSAVPLTPEGVEALPEPSRGFWTEIGSWLLGGLFAQAIANKFMPVLAKRFGNDATPALYDEAFIVSDTTSYSLGPHTDSAPKVLSALFYLPPDDSLAHLGTSLYVPKDHKFRCTGGPHHPFDKFERVMTMPFVPNSFLAFARTDVSFHGVQPITGPSVRRDILQYDIKTTMPTAVTAPVALVAAPAIVPPPVAKFSF